MKTKTIVFLLIASAFLLMSASCISDPIKSFENSVTKLSQNYQDYSPTKLKRSINKCESKIIKINSNKDKLSIRQKQTCIYQKARYTALLIQIRVHLAAVDWGYEAVEELRQYINKCLEELEHLSFD